MYQHSYAEALEDDQKEARRVEYEALDLVVSALTEAAASPETPAIGVQALYYTRKLWTAFISELAAPTNVLPTALRANLISIGVWIMKEADAIRLEKSSNYQGIADVCAIVRDGLK